MTTLVIDASVWVSAADTTDGFSKPSRVFLAQVVDHELPIALPEFAEMEIACALARRLRSAEHGRNLANQMLESPLVTTYSLNGAMHRKAIQVGTRSFLRAGDAVYAALAESMEGDVVSWDGELIERAGAITPDDWIEHNV